MSLTVLPFSVQLPSGYSLASSTPSASSTASASGSSTPSPAASPVDVVSFSNTANGGSFKVAAGDVYRLSDLVNGQTVTPGTAPASYRMALSAGGGQLMLNGTNVSARTSFTASEFSQLQYVVGTISSQSLVVVAQTGKLLSNGSLTQIVDSPRCRSAQTSQAAARSDRRILFG
jgi:hypothetical protein